MVDQSSIILPLFFADFHSPYFSSHTCLSLGDSLLYPSDCQRQLTSAVSVSVSRDTQHSALWLVGFDKPFLWFAVQVQHQWFLCRAMQSHCSGQCHWPVRDLSPPFLLVCCQRSLCISDVGHSLYKWLYLEKCSAETELNGEWILEIFKFPHSHLPPASPGHHNVFIRNLIHFIF